MHPFVQSDSVVSLDASAINRVNTVLYDHLLPGRFCWYVRFRSVLATLRMGRRGRSRSCLYRGFLVR